MSLHFVNQHGNPVSLCVVWYHRGCNPPWRKTGWWNLGNGGSATPIIGNLNAVYYYFYAQAWDGSYWGTGPNISVTNNRFDVCFDQIFEPARIVPLLEINTGQYLDYTVVLK